MAGKPRIPDSEHASIKSRYECGESTLQIAQTYNIGRDAIYLILKKKLGVDMTQPGGSASMSADDVEQIKSMYLSGTGSTTIARHFGINKTTVYNIMARAKIGMRPVHDRTGDTYGISEARLAQVMPTGNERGSGATPGKKDVDDHAFDVLTPEAAYWAGMLITDGNINDNQACGADGLSLGLKWSDYDHIQKFKNFVKSDHDIRHIYQKAGFIKGVPVHARESAKISFTSQHMVDTLERYGVTPRKSKWAETSDVLIHNKHFWRGCIDGDGSLYTPTEGKCGYLSGSPGLVKQFAQFVEEDLKLKLGEYVERPGCVVQWVARPSAILFMTNLYLNAPESMRLERKYQEAAQWFPFYQ